MTGSMQIILDFAKTAAGISVAVLVVAAIVRFLRWIGLDWPLELGGLFDRAHADEKQITVNVEYRDRDGHLIDLGDFVAATLRNGHGRVCKLSEGVFVGCDPDWIKAGAIVLVSIQSGLIREELNVMLDLQRHSLFVKSELSVDEIVRKINRVSVNMSTELAE